MLHLFELWCGYAPNIKYFNFFDSRFYIVKDNRQGKLDAKGGEGILLGYSTRSKAYNCLNSNTNKIMESVNVRVDEFVEKNEVEWKKEPKYYKNFVYVYEGESKLEKVVTEHQQPSTIEVQ